MTRDKMIAGLLEIKEVLGQYAWIRPEVLETLDAAMDGGDAWQTMDSAPLDGTPIIAFGRSGPNGKYPVFGVAHYHVPVEANDSEGWIAKAFYCASANAHGSFEPTHWQPMFSQPKTA